MDLHLKLLWLLCFYFKKIRVSSILPTQTHLLPLHTQGLLSVHLNKLQSTINPSGCTTTTAPSCELGMESTESDGSINV